LTVAACTRISVSPFMDVMAPTDESQVSIRSIGLHGR
jgi:hypothetical protein